MDLQRYKKIKSFYAPSDEKFPFVTLAQRGIFLDGKIPDFIHKTKDENDSISLEGQILKIPRGHYSRIVVIGFSMYGEYSGDFIFRRNGENIMKLRVGLNDLQSSNGLFNNIPMLRSNKMIDSEGKIYQMNTMIWEFDRRFKSIEVDEILLFDNPFAIIVDIDLKEE
ncbi:hypothetical protein HU830_08570 [Lactobacillus sp. DCY120]|uniref:Uncharacterized protein n=1 Tax=Bombilactobacillus apium TaxID=2675299 RepID=A0A850R8W3_9LACO|nr:hypothetical protein [Bombilactobacillus apium]NVY97172.1 hypothetical protein [Bombilactobacillus apium]